MKFKILGILIGTVFMGNALAKTNYCHLEFMTWDQNMFGDYTVYKKLWTEGGPATAQECYLDVRRYLKHYDNVPTKWSEIRLSYWDGNGKISAKTYIK